MVQLVMECRVLQKYLLRNPQYTNGQNSFEYLLIFYQIKGVGRGAKSVHAQLIILSGWSFMGPLKISCTRFWKDFLQLLCLLARKPDSVESEIHNRTCLAFSI